MKRALAALVLAASAAASAMPTAVESAPQTASGPRFKLTLTRPMLAPGNVRLDPGDYDVTFAPAPAGMPHFIATFSRGGVPVAKTPAELKGATAGFKLSNVDIREWVRGSFTDKHARKDGSITPLKFEMKAESERAFFEALVTEVTIPALDGSSKAPATLAVISPRSLPTTVTPTPTPSKK